MFRDFVEDMWEQLLEELARVSNYPTLPPPRGNHYPHDREYIIAMLVSMRMVIALSDARTHDYPMTDARHEEIHDIITLECIEAYDSRVAGDPPVLSYID